VHEFDAGKNENNATNQSNAFALKQCPIGVLMQCLLLVLQPRSLMDWQ